MDTDNHYLHIQSDAFDNENLTYEVYSNTDINHMLEVVDLVNKYPNDQELGEKIRSFVNKYYNYG